MALLPFLPSKELTPTKGQVHAVPLKIMKFQALGPLGGTPVTKRIGAQNTEHGTEAEGS